TRLLVVGASLWSSAFARALIDAGGEVLVVDNVWRRLRAPRLAGVPVYYGEILSDRAEAALELTDVGSLLAAGANDAYNALVCASFAADLGRENVFQLPLHGGEDGDPRGLTRPRRGRIAIAAQAHHEWLEERLGEGWRFQKTQFSETFTYQDFLAQASGEGVAVALRLADGSLFLAASDESRHPRAGDVLLSFAPPKPLAAGAEAQT
ncbi:MAG TPA: NAD-binding protein, partial [Gammaproteobacteria bacterium]|nr:NAD-binding protein [Gammaproteobacteria bacterium]